MKKTVFFAIALTGLALASCKKDYTCECTTTSTNSYTDASGTTTTSTPPASKQTTAYKKVKKSNLKTLCGDQKSTSSSIGTDGSGGTTNSSYTSETTCTIK